MFTEENFDGYIFTVISILQGLYKKFESKIRHT